MKKVLIVLLILIVSVSVFAKDKNGLFLSAGLGTGSLTPEREAEGTIGPFTITETETGDAMEVVSFDAKAGIGFGNLVIFANYKILVENEDDSETFGQDETLGIQLAGLGASYFINSLYITGTIGEAKYRCLSDSEIDKDIQDNNDPGVGVYFGAGLELNQGLSLEAGIVAASFEYYNGPYDDGEVSFDNLTITDTYAGLIISVNLLMY